MAFSKSTEWKNEETKKFVGTVYFNFLQFLSKKESRHLVIDYF